MAADACCFITIKPMSRLAAAGPERSTGSLSRARAACAGGAAPPPSPARTPARKQPVNMRDARHARRLCACAVRAKARVSGTERDARQTSCRRQHLQLFLVFGVQVGKQFLHARAFAQQVQQGVHRELFEQRSRRRAAGRQASPLLAAPAPRQEPRTHYTSAPLSTCWHSELMPHPQ